MMPIRLSATLDTSAAAPLLIIMKQAIDRTEPIVVDASDVERIGQACLQVIAAAQVAAQVIDLRFEIVNPSSAFVEMTDLAGLALLAAA